MPSRRFTRVVAGNGITHTSVWDGGLTLSARNRGCDGVVVVRREEAERVLEECGTKSRVLLAARDWLTNERTTFVALRGGRALIEKAGVTWIE
jgi:regulator of RNase E activity RraA